MMMPLLGTGVVRSSLGAALPVYLSAIEARPVMPGLLVSAQ